MTWNFPPISLQERMDGRRAMLSFAQIVTSILRAAVSLIERPRPQYCGKNIQ